MEKRAPEKTGDGKLATGAQEQRSPGPMKLRHLRQQQASPTRKAKQPEKSSVESGSPQPNGGDELALNEKADAEQSLLAKPTAEGSAVSNDEGTSSLQGKEPKKVKDPTPNDESVKDERLGGSPTSTEEKNAKRPVKVKAFNETKSFYQELESTLLNKIKIALEVAKDVISPEKDESDQSSNRSNGKNQTNEEDGKLQLSRPLSESEKEKEDIPPVVKQSVSVEREALPDNTETGPTVTLDQTDDDDLTKPVQKPTKKFEATRFKAARSKSSSKSRRRREGELPSVEEDEELHQGKHSDCRRRHSRHSSKHRRHSFSATRKTDKTQGDSSGQGEEQPVDIEANVPTADEVDVDDRPQGKGHDKTPGPSIFQRVKGTLAAAKDAMANDSVYQSYPAKPVIERKKDTHRSSATRENEPESTKEQAARDTDAAVPLQEESHPDSQSATVNRKDSPRPVAEESDETERLISEKSESDKAEENQRSTKSAGCHGRNSAIKRTVEFEEHFASDEPDASVPGTVETPRSEAANSFGETKSSPTKVNFTKDEKLPKTETKPVKPTNDLRPDLELSSRPAVNESPPSTSNTEKFEEDGDLQSRRARRKTPTGITTDKINLPYSFLQKPTEKTLDLDDDSEANSFTMTDSLYRAPLAIKWAAAVVGCMMLLMAAAALHVRLTKKEIISTAWIPKIAILIVVILLVSLIFGSFADARFTKRGRSDSKNRPPSSKTDRLKKT